MSWFQQFDTGTNDLTVGNDGTGRLYFHALRSEGLPGTLDITDKEALTELAELLLDFARPEKA